MGKHPREENAMTEQPSPPVQPDTADEVPAERPERHRDRPDAVRTQGETAVDDAIGTGDNVH
jgi:hypothetical protein